MVLLALTPSKLLPGETGRFGAPPAAPPASVHVPAGSGGLRGEPAALFNPSRMSTVFPPGRAIMSRTSGSFTTKCRELRTSSSWLLLLSMVDSAKIVCAPPGEASRSRPTGEPIGDTADVGNASPDTA
ncbi:hypothetical protein Vretifemale_1913, partial [Volvox reticuliferus]